MTFEFYDDANHKRFLMIKNLCSETNILGSLIIYYGLPGMGKSITLIKTFKYEYNHKIFGTLYINCKYFFKSYMNDFNQMKNTLKDEIAYLFQDEFKEYEKCIEWIDKINKDINKNFWNIIIYIIKTYCVNKSKKYIYIFDQYKNELDMDKELYNLNEYLKNKENKKKYGIIVCCSMDNKSVRELKVNNLFQKKIDYKADNIKVKEIKYLFDISNLTIDDNGIFDQTLEKIGKNIKNIIILKDFYRYKDYNGLKNYVKISKNKICNNLKNFFGINDNSNKKNEEQETSFKYLTPLLSFTVDTDYDDNYLESIKNYIPFKYFDIQKIKSKKNYSKIIQYYLALTPLKFL